MITSLLKRHVANVITSLRIIFLPVLIYFVIVGNVTGFFWLAFFMMITDIIDGTIARVLHQESHLGVVLDSYADVGFFPIFFLGTILLFRLSDFMPMYLILLPIVVHAFGSFIFPMLFIHKIEYFHLRLG